MGSSWLSTSQTPASFRACGVTFWVAILFKRIEFFRVGVRGFGSYRMRVQGRGASVVAASRWYMQQYEQAPAHSQLLPFSRCTGGVALRFCQNESC